MGQAIEKVLNDKGHSITGIIHKSNVDELAHFLTLSDVAIEFTGPLSAFENIKACFKAGVPVVSGSTGWLDQWEEMTKFQIQYNGTLMWASNFSIGVNLFFEMNRMLAKLSKTLPLYKYIVEEVHHTAKVDKPSGTALTLVSDILQDHKEYNGWILDPQEEQNQFIPVNTKREGNVVGYHQVKLIGPNDQILLSHEAFNRSEFASGAVIGAEWIKDKIGIYSMGDLLQFTMQG